MVALPRSTVPQACRQSQGVPLSILRVIDHGVCSVWMTLRYFSADAPPVL